MGTYYENATICLNGHVISSNQANYSPYCSSCGVSTISNCQSCNAAIEGDYVNTEIPLFYPYSKPSYCPKCGNPYPWTSRIIDSAIELLALDEELPPEQHELIKLALPDLLIEKPSTPVAIAKYKKFIPKAATYVQDGLKNIFIDVVSESVKKSIWG